MRDFKFYGDTCVRPDDLFHVYTSPHLVPTYFDDSGTQNVS